MPPGLPSWQPSRRGKASDRKETVLNQILSVSQINSYLKDLLEEDVQLKSIYVRGEISNFVHHLKSGHFYFTLKDERSALRAVMFKWNASRLRFMPKNGMNVILFGSVNFYERDGVCQLLCVDMQPDGLGALYMAYEQLKEKLAREGLFDPAHKKPLPPFPRRIGVVTAKTGAALQDIIHILSRRYPLAELVLYPALVQGDLAPDSLVKAIGIAGRDRPDVLIVGRGGGSLEDLWAFNDERVARAVHDCPVPVISAVGHEVDYTICDLVADLRAPTPSAAAELCAPDISGLKEELSDLRDTLRRGLSDRIRMEEASLRALSRRLGVSSPENFARRSAERLSALESRMRAAMNRKLALSEADLGREKARLSAVSPARRLPALDRSVRELSSRLNRGAAGAVSRLEAQLKQAEASLEALSPLGVLARGYTLTEKDGRAASLSALQPGDEIRTRFHDGTITSRVTGVFPKGVQNGDQETTDL